MKIPWDDYDAYCQKIWKEAEERWREGTRQLQTQERTRLAVEAQQRKLQEDWERTYKENAGAREAERRERERQREELLKENARVRAMALEKRAEEDRREREAWAQRVREQEEEERKREREYQERRERRQAATALARQRAQEQREKERAGLSQDDLNRYEDDRYAPRGVSLDELEEITARWEAGYRLDEAESGYYEAGYLMQDESHRESALVRMAEYHCERLAGKRMYARPFSQMKIIPCGYEPTSKRERRAAARAARG